MAVPIVLGLIAGASAIYGATKAIQGAVDHNDAKEINESAKSIVDTSSQSVNSQREATNVILTNYGERKLRAFHGVVGDFIEAFSRLKNVEISQTPELDKLNLRDFTTVTLKELKHDYLLLKNSGLGLGAGATGGAALAFGAYNGTMMLATASTGTAISTLSGVAASNATLAWLGGGAISMGGGGMALGTMILGGMVAGPALAIFGHIVGNKGAEALNNARSNLEQAKTMREEAKLMVNKLKAVASVVELANKTLSSASSHLRRSVNELKKVIDAEGVNFRELTAESQESVLRSVKFAQLVKALIDTPILDKDGNLVLSTEKRLMDLEDTMS